MLIIKKLICKKKGFGAVSEIKIGKIFTFKRVDFQKHNHAARPDFKLFKCGPYRENSVVPLLLIMS